MNPQQNIFSDFELALASIPISRKRDPEPSQESATLMNKGKRVKNMDIVLEVLKIASKKGSLTSRELYGYYCQYFESKGIDKMEVARRLSDLKKLGLISFGGLHHCIYSKKNLSSYVCKESK